MTKEEMKKFQLMRVVIHTNDGDTKEYHHIEGITTSIHKGVYLLNQVLLDSEMLEFGLNPEFDEDSRCIKVQAKVILVEIESN